MGGDQVPLCTSGVLPPGARLALWSWLLSALSTEKYLKDSGNELTFFSFFLSSPSFSKTVQPSWKKANKTSVTILKIIGKPVLNAMALNVSPGRKCRLGSPLFLTPRCTCGKKAGQPSALKSEELMGPEEHPCPKRPCAPHTHGPGGECTRVCGPRPLVRQPSALTASIVWPASARHGGDYRGFIGVHGVVRNNIVGCVGIEIEVFSFRPSGQNAFPLMRKKVFPVFQLERCLPVEVTADACMALSLQEGGGPASCRALRRREGLSAAQAPT